MNEPICPSCGKTDRTLWPEGCNNAWHREGMEAALRERDERIEALENQRTVAINAEKSDCTRALVALSAAGISTPEETYGYNTSWAISDLCRAVAALRQQVERLSAPVKDAENFHFENDEVLAAVQNTPYAKQAIGYRLIGMTVDQKGSLYRAVVKLARKGAA
jgi:hypothetical protein